MSELAAVGCRSSTHQRHSSRRWRTRKADIWPLPLGVEELDSADFDIRDRRRAEGSTTHFFFHSGGQFDVPGIVRMQRPKLDVAARGRLNARILCVKVADGSSRWTVQKSVLMESALRRALQGLVTSMASRAPPMTFPKHTVALTPVCRESGVGHERLLVTVQS